MIGFKNAKLILLNGKIHLLRGKTYLLHGKIHLLNGKTFIMTGSFPDLDRNVFKDLVVEFGGKVASSISKNTNYVLVGSGAGASKLNKISELKSMGVDINVIEDIAKFMRNARRELAEGGHFCGLDELFLRPFELFERREITERCDTDKKYRDGKLLNGHVNPHARDKKGVAHKKINDAQGKNPGQ